MHCKSFTDNNKSVKWCPYSKEGCEYAAQRASDFVANKLVGLIGSVKLLQFIKQCH